MMRARTNPYWRHRRKGRPPASHARAAVLSMAGIFIATQVALAAALDLGPSWLRDPEYGAEESRLTAVLNSGAPVPIIALGSSRLVEGLRPSVLGRRPPV